MTANEVASTVGTWVAAFITIVALVGVVGPLLVWRASRRERHRALDQLDAGHAENGGFVTKGLNVGKNIRLFRQVKAPLLRKSPKIPATRLKWNPAATLPTSESYGWVQFGASIRAFGLTYPAGDELSINGGRAALPISRSWLFVFEFMGRFAHRDDEGKCPVKVAKGVGSKQALPGRQIQSLALGLPSSDNNQNDVSTESDDSYPDRRRRRARHRRARRKTKLHCVTGAMTLGAGSSDAVPGGVEYRSHSQEQIGDLALEPLSIDKLFWLSVGCIPFGSQRVLSMEDPVDVVRDPSSSDTDTSNPDRYETVLRRSRNDRDRRRMSIDRRRTRSYATYIASAPMPTAAMRDLDGRPDRNRSRLRPRKFRFSVTEERVESLAGVAILAGAETEVSETLCMEEVPVRGEELDSLQDDAGWTYVPSERDWIRLGERSDSGDPYSLWFLERSDAQSLARGLLELPLCPPGYLIQHSGSACRAMLSTAFDSLTRLLSHLILDIHHFGLTGQEQSRLLDAMNAFWPHTEDFEYKRTFASALFDLDDAIARSVAVDQHAALFIQVLILTTAEFRDLIIQSLRQLKQCLSSSVTVDLAASTINLASLFGVVRKFPIDIDVLVTEPQALDRTQQVHVPYAQVLLLVLKAVLRSTFLRTSLDSEPLFESILSLEDIVHVS